MSHLSKGRSREHRKPGTPCSSRFGGHGFRNGSLENRNAKKTEEERQLRRGKNNNFRRGEKEKGGNGFADSVTTKSRGRRHSQPPCQFSKEKRSNMEQWKLQASTPVVDFGRLKDWYEKNEENLIDSIMLEENCLFQALDDVTAVSTLDTFHLLLSIVLKAVDLGSRASESIFFLSKVRSSSLISKGFLNFYTKLLTHDSDPFHVHESGVTIFVDSVKLLKVIMEKFPSSLEKIIHLYSMVQVILSKSKLSVDDLKYFDDLNVMVENAKINWQQVSGRDGRNVSKVYPPPSDNFRDMMIVPKFDRDLAYAREPYLRPIVTKGGFQDVEHYLDVHFRLLREDFVGPLRDGIKDFLLLPNCSPKDLRIYNGVRIVRTELKQTGILHRIKFNVYNLKNVDWNVSKRFIYGSLLYISNNNFKDVLIATVKDSNPNGLAKGFVDIQFETPALAFHGSKVFDMLESTSMFEAYRHVLDFFVAVNPVRFPFKEIIVFCRPVNNPPKYLTDGERASFFAVINTKELIKSNECKNQSRCRIVASKRVALLDTSSNLNQAGFKESPFSKGIDILDEHAWPAADVLGLEEMQLKALRHSLTSEVSIVQGPPGTGKTFLGLKVIEILLANWENWNVLKNPMLVVCYTNHALDQFMEGISKFLENGLVRVGSRCQSEILKKYTLFELKRSNKYRHIISYGVRTRKRDIKREMKPVEQRLYKYKADINRLKNGIVNENILRVFMTNEQFCSLRTVRPPYGGSSILYWLQIKETLDGGTQNIELTEEQWSIVEDGADEENVFREQKQTDGIQQKNKGSNELSLQIIQIKKIKKRIKQYLNRYHPMDFSESEKVSDVWTLSSKDRWRLYLLWIRRHEGSLQEIMNGETQTYNDLVADLKNISSNVDKHIMQGAKVIGMTTTCAARCRKVLSNIKPSVVLVEEAAEVLESHIIASLNPDCQHLILIGDHQQLRPSANVYKLETKYNLNVSLFERLITNDIPYVSLEKQHRMRPEIADFARITYPRLKDDASVLKFDSIKGISSNVFFINHNMKETQNDQLSSASNDHEARLLVRLCRYLLQQGYSNEQITILTPYLGQVLRIKYYALKEEQKLQEVKVCSVDNYQGEENDIVLLSLVRSNFEKKIGFLKESNRLNVAMTRAKKGLFVIGNFDMLKLKSDFVRKICKIATEREIPVIGTKLHLSCQNHPSTKTSVSTADDFDQSPEGGCRLPCRFTLTCGHTCTRSCHPYDTDHSLFQCLKACPRILEPCKHSCQKACYETCRCEVMMLKTIPKCQHQHFIMCYVDPEKFVCPEKCLHVLPCGHGCTRTCGEGHTVSCKFLVLKTFDCGHETRLFCSAIKMAKCRVMCKVVLKCGHLCEGDCSKCSNGERHVPCRRICEKILPCQHPCSRMCLEDCGKCLVLVTKKIPRCGHFQEMKCSTLPENFVCRGKCFFKLPCGHDCLEKCGLKHTENCNAVEQRTLECGHEISFRCSAKSQTGTDFICTSECGKVMECGHICRATCGECSKRLNHFSCHEPCERILPCQHRCRRSCFETCECDATVKSTVSGCLHEQEIKCGTSPESVLCRGMCSRKLPCGHMCAEACSSKHTERCRVEVTKSLDCGHEVKVLCRRSHKKDIACKAKCKKTLECGHVCKGTCVECFQGRVHVRCNEKCKKILVCGHPCNGLCSDECPPCRRPCENGCTHKKCSKRCGEPCDPCHRECSLKCLHHVCKRPCHAECDRPRCDHPCNKRLECGHLCISLCEENCFCRPCQDSDRFLADFFINHAKKKQEEKEDETEESKYVRLTDCQHVFEVGGLDEWMDAFVKASEIAPLSCPMCKTLIRHSRRYRPNVVSTRMKIEKVMAKVSKQRLELDGNRINEILTILDEIKDVLAISRPMLRNYSSGQIATMHCGANLLIHLDSLRRSEISEKKVADRLRSRIARSFLKLSIRECQDLQFETVRLELLLAFGRQNPRITDGDATPDVGIVSDILQSLDHLRARKLDSETETKMRDLLENRNIQLAIGSEISEVKKIQNIRCPIGPRSPWFQCPKGHVYCPEYGEIAASEAGRDWEVQCDECTASPHQ